MEIGEVGDMCIISNVRRLVASKVSDVDTFLNKAKNPAIIKMRLHFFTQRLLWRCLLLGYLASSE